MKKNLVLPSIPILVFLQMIPGMIFVSRKSYTTPPDYDSIRDDINKLVKKEMKRHKVTGLSLVLIDGDRTVFAEGFGYADLEQKKAITPETVFPVGSISKLFTATAIMQLAEQGKIDIDKPLHTYLPEFSMKTRYANTEPITIRSIMTHHSGLPDAWHEDFLTANPPYFTSLLDKIKNDYTAYPPNYIAAYSNMGMSLLGMVVERESGMRFNDYITANILRPLMMNHSTLEPRDDLVPFLTKGYRLGKRMDEGAVRDIPAGGLHTSVADLGRFIQMVLKGGCYAGKEIVKPETLAAMLTPQNENVPLDLDLKMGLNWFLSDPELEYAGKVAHHGGNTLLFHSMLKILPEQNLGVAVLSNSATGTAAVANIAKETLKLALEIKTGLKAPESPCKSILGQGFTDEQLVSFVGNYGNRSGLISITRNRNSLKLALNGKTLRMIPCADGWFTLQVKVFGVIPVTLHDKLIFTIKTIHQTKVLVTKNEGIGTVFAEAIKPTPISDLWLKRLGVYKITGQDQSLFWTSYAPFQLTTEKGFLTMCFNDKIRKLKGRLILTPLNEDEALIRGLGRGGHEIIRFTRIHGEEILWYMGLQMKKLK